MNPIESIKFIQCGFGYADVLCIFHELHDYYFRNPLQGI